VINYVCKGNDVNVLLDEGGGMGVPAFGSNLPICGCSAGPTCVQFSKNKIKLDTYDLL
jgi:hypothetical protein